MGRVAIDRGKAAEAVAGPSTLDEDVDDAVESEPELEEEEEDNSRAADAKDGEEVDDCSSRRAVAETTKGTTGDRRRRTRGSDALASGDR